MVRSGVGGGLRLARADDAREWVITVRWLVARVDPAAASRSGGGPVALAAVQAHLDLGRLAAELRGLVDRFQVWHGRRPTT